MAPAVVGSLALLILGTALPAAGSNPRHARGLSAATRDRLAAAYGRLPLSFAPNRGQANRRVRLIAHGAGYVLGLTDSGALLALDRHSGAAARGGRAARALTADASGRGGHRLRRVSVRTVSVGFVGESPRVRLTAGRELPGRVNYLIGNDRHRWQTNIPTFSGATYRGVWTGIDATFTGSRDQLEYVFDIAPGADSRQIRLGYHGQSSLRLDAAGNLILTAGAGRTVRQLAPRAYQLTGGRRRTVASRYVLSGDRVSIRLGAYDHHRALVLDPTVTLAYSTYLGGSVEGDGAGIAVDSSGDAYVTGFTISSDFSTHDPLQRKLGGRGYPPFADAFVAKLNPAGSALLYSTYLGGSGGDAGVGIAVDTAGDAYVTGNTTSTDFPTHDPLQPKFAGANGTSGAGNAFVAKLNPAGSALLYSTYLGGSGGGDVGQGIAVDSAGDAYVTGFTFSLDFPTHDPLQPKNGGAGGGVNGGNAFVAKLNPAGSALLYSTYLGGSSNDSGQGIAVDTAGDAYVTGYTDSRDFPTHNPLQRKFAGGRSNVGFAVGDAFVAKLNPAGSALVYSTYLGGRGFDAGQGIALDTAGDAYVTGNTTSTDFPTHDPLQPKNASGTNGGTSDAGNAFVAKLNPAGSALLYSTYLGGRGDDSGQGIAVDTAGDAYVTGFTFSLDFPTHDPLQPKNGAAGGGVNGGTAFVAKLNPAGSALLYSTYLGGSDDDSGQGIALDTAGDAYVTGNTSSPDFPTHNPLQPKLPGIENPFVAKLGPVVADGSARLHLRRFHLSPARLGCKVESSRRAHTASLTDSDCPLALLRIAGTIDRRADGQKLTITLRTKLGHRSVLIITHPRIGNGRWRLRVGLPGRDREPGDRWRFTIAYPGGNSLRPAAITGGFQLETEIANNSPL